MGNIVVHEFTTLDGVIDAPTWTFDFEFDPKMGTAIAEIMGGCKGLLLWRRTFEMFAPAWSARTAADDPGAPFMNESPKYVVGSPSRVEWNNSTSVGQYSKEAIRELKERTPGGLYVSGSGTLVRALLADGLVDELHLFIYPVALGKGGRLFAESGDLKKFTLARSEAFDNGVLLAVYK